ncbi:uncharacterized protein LOC143460852 [Clavelina lepadiformis]|uniref:uncharacterized protein LOC143460852 n=1 Tax=Clavelina lepadiformis TaxID=159417 RepID=UPI004042CC3F
MMNSSQNQTNSSDGSLCQQDKSVYRYVEAAFASISVAMHIFILLSILIYGKHFRQKPTNIYATNLIVANFMAGLIRIFSNFSWFFNEETVAAYNHLNRKKIHYHLYKNESLLMLWYAVAVLNLMLFLVITAAMCLLVNSLRINIFQINNSRSGQGRSSVQEHAEICRGICNFLVCLKTRPRAVALWCIFLSWLIPILGAVVVVLMGNNCVFTCHCVFNYLPLDTSLAVCPPIESCHQLLIPMTNYAVIVGVVIWLVFAIVLGCILILSCKDFQHFKLQRKNALRVSYKHKDDSDDHVLEITSPNGEEEPDKDEQNSLDLETSKPISNENSSKILTKFPKQFNLKDQSGSIFLESVRKNLIYLFILSIAFVIGYGFICIPSLVIAIDPQSLNYFSIGFLTIMYWISLEIEMLLSIITCCVTPGLKRSVKKLCFVILSCSRYNYVT